MSYIEFSTVLLRPSMNHLESPLKRRVLGPWDGAVGDVQSKSNELPLESLLQIENQIDKSLFSFTDS